MLFILFKGTHYEAESTRRVLGGLNCPSNWKFALFLASMLLEFVASVSKAMPGATSGYVKKCCVSHQHKQLLNKAIIGFVFYESTFF